MPADDGGSPPDRDAQLQELHDRLTAAVGALQTGEQWQAWLAFARGFHHYSFNNVLLIQAQNPAATVVAGYRTWAAKGRQVRRGEKALRVLGPVTRTERLVDPDGHRRTRRRCRDRQ
jgi:hypothetical protein